MSRPAQDPNDEVHYSGDRSDIRENNHNLQAQFASPVSNGKNIQNTHLSNNLQISPVEDVRRVEHSSRRESEKHAQLRSPHPDRIADQLIVQAEKFKAKIEAPKGNGNYSNGNYSSLLMPYDYEKLRDKFVKPDGLAPIDSEILFLRNFDQDDEFFHVTSQIDPSLRIKIERGEFIDLE